jgi:hypothetical protein
MLGRELTLLRSYVQPIDREAFETKKMLQRPIDFKLILKTELRTLKEGADQAPCRTGRM